MATELPKNPDDVRQLVLDAAQAVYERQATST